MLWPQKRSDGRIASWLRESEQVDGTHRQTGSPLTTQGPKDPCAPCVLRPQRWVLLVVRSIACPQRRIADSQLSLSPPSDPAQPQSHLLLLPRATLMDPVEEERLRECKRAAEHMADATEQLVFDMLVKGGVTADTISPSLGMGVLVGPASFIKYAKAAVLKGTGLQTISRAVPWKTQPRRDPDEPCQN